MTPLRRRMTEDMQLRNLSPHTRRAYLRYVALFAQQFQKSPELLGLRIPTMSAIDSDRNQPPVPIEASRGFR